MKRKLSVLFVCCMAVLTAWGQSISKQINDIKRSSQYISAEATLEGEAQAYRLAEELLTKQISEYAATQKSLKNAPNVIVKDVAGKAEKLQMNRGTMTRVFLYVKKGDIIAADNTRVLLQQPQTDIAAAETQHTQASTSETISASRQTPVEGGEVGSEAKPRAADENMQNDKRADVINALLNCSQAGEAQGKLQRFRVEQLVKRFGPADKCPDVSGSFWLIFNNQGKVVTVLGEGTSGRTNYRTMQQDTLDNYKGMGAVWFTMPK